MAIPSTSNVPKHTAITVSAALLVGALLLGAAYHQWQQVQLDRHLVEVIRRPDASLAAVDALLDRGADPNHRELTLPLLSASPQGLGEATDWLRRPERRNGSTALVEAACRGRADLVRELLARGADVRVTTGESYGGHPVLLHWSENPAPHGVEVARLLVEHGADVNGRTPEGATPLMFAVEYHDARVVRFLLRRGADPNARDSRGWTPLRYGIGSGNIDPDSVRALLESRAEVNARANDGITPLGRARQAQSSPAILAILRAAGARE